MSISLDAATDGLPRLLEETQRLVDVDFKVNLFKAVVEHVQGRERGRNKDLSTDLDTGGDFCKLAMV